jgi:hypothetical protein
MSQFRDANKGNAIESDARLFGNRLVMEVVSGMELS